MRDQELDQKIALLGSHAAELLNDIDEMQDDLERLRAEAGTIDEVREAFGASLSPTWARLAPKLSNVDSLEALEHAVGDVEQFLVDLQRLILRPRRAKLDKQLDSWLSTWTTTKVDWDRFLEESTDEQMEDLEALIEEAEPSDLEHAEFDKIWKRWIRHQVGELKQREKNHENLKDWLDLLDENWLEALNLDGFLQSASGAVDNDPVIGGIQQKWVDGTLVEIAAIKAEQPELDLGKEHMSLESGWEDLNSALGALRPSVQSLSDAESHLTVRAFSAWKGVDAAKVQDLVERLATVASLIVNPVKGCTIWGLS